MEYLFNYTLKKRDQLISLVEDAVAFKRILNEKKNSDLSQINLLECEKNIKKSLLILRILEQVSYLEDVNIDLNRSIESIDRFIEDQTYTTEEGKKISYYLSGIMFDDVEIEAGSMYLGTPTLQQNLVNSLDEVMKTIEEILLSYYGLISPIEDLESKLIRNIEQLFELRLEDLEMEEKLLVEDFFNHIQMAFQLKSTEGWEECYIKATSILNDLKQKAGVEPSNALQITYETADDENEDYIIEFEIDEDFFEDDDSEDRDEDDFESYFDDEDY